MKTKSTSNQALVKGRVVSNNNLVLLLFIFLLTFCSALFLAWFDQMSDRKQSKWIAHQDHKTELIQTSYQLRESTVEAFNFGLAFLLDGNEADRITTIYALRDTKANYEQFAQKIKKSSNLDELDSAVTQLGSKLSHYENSILESINLDEGADRVRETVISEMDTIAPSLFTNESIAKNGVELREVQIALKEIDNELASISNAALLSVEQQIHELSFHTSTIWYILLPGTLSLIFLSFSWIKNRKQKDSIGSIRKVLQGIAQGDLRNRSLKISNEYQSVVDACENLTKYIGDATTFAKKIGEGDFEFEFKTQGKKDSLGNSLLEMRDRLSSVTKKDKQRNWFNEGQAKFGEVLRQNSNDLNELGNSIVKGIVEYLNAFQGAMFIVNQGDEEFLHQVALFAFNRKKCGEKKIQIGEGLAGQVFQEGKSIYLEEILSDHYDIYTALGSSKPTCVLIVPLKNEDSVEGVIELAFMRKLERFEIEFVESIAETVASSIKVGKVNETTQQLLIETQEKAEQMKAQEEELRQNMEELSATQENVERRNRELEELQTVLDQQHVLFNTLMEKSPDRIYFKDLEGRYIKASKQMDKQFGADQDGGILGKTDFDLAAFEIAEGIVKLDKEIIRNQQGVEGVIEKSFMPTGEVQWFEVTKDVMKDQSGNVLGIFGYEREVKDLKNENNAES